LRAGFHHGVHVKSYEAHERRTLLKARDVLVAERRTLQNKVRGLLETFGLVLGKGSGGRFAALVEEALRSRPSLRVAIEPLLAGPWGPRSPTGDAALADGTGGDHRAASPHPPIGPDRSRLPPTDDHALRGLLAASPSEIGSKASWPSMAWVRSRP
jgi:hypothetical protein